MTTPHIGPSRIEPGEFGYEFDCSLSDCHQRYHSLDRRDPLAGILEIVPPDGKVAHLKIGALIKAAPALFAALSELQANPNDPRAHRAALDALSLARQ